MAPVSGRARLLELTVDGTLARLRPEIRVRAASVFNHTTWGAPVTSFTSPSFLTFTPDRANNGLLTNTGAFVSSTLGPRVVQVGLRLEF